MVMSADDYCSYGKNKTIMNEIITTTVENNNIKRYPNCKIRTKFGNCDAIGGFCTSVNEPICDAFHKLMKDRPTGKWEVLSKFEDLNGVTIYVLRCSKCGALHRVRKLYLGSYINAEYCPHCGEKMGGDEGE